MVVVEAAGCGGGGSHPEIQPNSLRKNVPEWLPAPSTCVKVGFAWEPSNRHFFTFGVRVVVVVEVKTPEKTALHHQNCIS